tara:strand:- start:633 stop:1088 length:456 start_codon:yes stop_codon:yes gene_type:complete
MTTRVIIAEMSRTDHLLEELHPENGEEATASAVMWNHLVQAVDQVLPVDWHMDGEGDQSGNYVFGIDPSKQRRLTVRMGDDALVHVAPGDPVLNDIEISYSTEFDPDPDINDGDDWEGGDWSDPDEYATTIGGLPAAIGPLVGLGEDWYDD